MFQVGSPSPTSRLIIVSPQGPASHAMTDMRTRRGCWKCRERRVKCPEQRPICRHCERLGFVCKYDIRLTWQAVVSVSPPRGSTPGLQRPAWATRHWMFINAYGDDFSDTQRAAPGRSLRPAVVETFADADGTDDEEDDDVDDDDHHHYLVSQYDSTIPSPWLFPPRDVDGVLFDYFDSFIAPQCALDHSANPYRHILLRVAASAPEGPLFYGILAASANQLHNLGHAGYERKMWQHRAKALRLLRRELEATHPQPDHGLLNGRAIAQVVGSSVMLCFFEILRDCSESWTIHTDFAASYLQQYLARSRFLGSDEQELVRFSIAYSSSHSILAATASTRLFTPSPIPEDSTIQTLTGCSHELLSLISRTSQLAYDQATFGPSVEIAERRNDIERQLTELYQPIPPDAGADESELALVAETKRLTALLYVYSRVDNAGPHEPRITRLTGQILSLIQEVSLRTNTILWPLFMVGTLGVRPENDEHRKFVLERLRALQETRQLGNVKKARQILEDVWKARDLRKADATKAWSILTDRHGTLSLA